MVKSIFKDLRLIHGVGVFNFISYYFEVRRWMKRYGVHGLNTRKSGTFGIICMAVRSGADPRDIAWALLQ